VAHERRGLLPGVDRPGAAHQLRRRGHHRRAAAPHHPVHPRVSAASPGGGFRAARRTRRIAPHSAVAHQRLGRAAAPERARMRPRVCAHVHQRRQHRLPARRRRRQPDAPVRAAHCRQRARHARRAGQSRHARTRRDQRLYPLPDPTRVPHRGVNRFLPGGAPHFLRP